MSTRARVLDALIALDRAADLGAVVARDDAAALAAADQLDQIDALDAGASVASSHVLAGRTITVKDWIDVTGLPCEGESPTRTGHVPARDATAVARLRRAGAIVVAKTQPGADHPQHGRCHHPLDPARSPGGSSSGEAALIGCGASRLGLGSDSGGSIRLPAAWCGAVGMKPSAGLVPTTGHRPRVGDRVDGRTVIGPIAATVSDVATSLRLIAGPDGIDAGCAPVRIDAPSVDVRGLRGLRVAMVTGDGGWAPAASTRDAVTRAVDLLVGFGATLVDDALPSHLDESLDITQRYWRRAAHDPALTGVDVDRQLRDWDRFASRLTRATAAVDVVIGPVVRDVAPLARPLAGEDYVYTLPWSLTGAPAISLPAGRDTATGMPVAVQIASSRWRDAVVIGVAAALESALAAT
ncbi:MAG: amidase [Acidimicrobiales bacterium]|nr:amidase [Acidimicrobiales bacterium]MCB9394089.1 amidase [Acidimicrobiaceae bacterium]